MSATINTLPNWKKNATAADRLEELASLAREFPERFEHFVIVYREQTKAGRWRNRTHRFSLNAEHQAMDYERAMGILDAGKLDIYLESAGLL